MKWSSRPYRLPQKKTIYSSKARHFVLALGIESFLPRFYLLSFFKYLYWIQDYRALLNIIQRFSRYNKVSIVFPIDKVKHGYSF